MEGNITLKVAVDAMGGDYAPGEIIKGVVDALSKCHDLEIILTGVESRIKDCLQDFYHHGNRLKIFHAPDVIYGNDDPGISIRKKKNSSMVITQKMAASGEVDAVLSAGNTGALMAGGLLFLGRIPGISRPALLTTMPVFRGKESVVLDVGANMDATPEQLLQYSFMGIVYAREVLKRNNPSVALLNVGTEDNKGNDQAKKTFKLLKEHIPSFIGNIEGSQVFNGVADVIVCDGFVGNIFLKTTEGLATGILGNLKNDFLKNIGNKLAAGLLHSSLNEIQSRTDSSEFGGAPLIGVNGICIKCHGASKSAAISNAIIKQIYPLCKNKVNQSIENIIKENICSIKNLKNLSEKGI